MLIGDLDDVTPYTVLHNGTNVLRKRPSGSSVVKGVCPISEKVKDYAHRYFKMMKEYINPVFHTWVVIENVAVKVAEFKDVPF